MMEAMNDAFVLWLKYIGSRYDHIPMKEREVRESYWDVLNALNDSENGFQT